MNDTDTQLAQQRAVRNPNGTGKIHLRDATGELGCRGWGAFLTQRVPAAELASVGDGEMCRRCWPVGAPATNEEGRP